MARSVFGGTLSEFVSTAKPGPSLISATVWTAQTGGSQITDLLTASGQPVEALSALTATSGFVQFQGPDDGTDVVWVQCSAAGRVKMIANVPAANLRSNTVLIPGASVTLPAPSVATINDYTLVEASTAFTFPTVVEGAQIWLVLRQSGAGSLLATFLTPHWPGGTEPTLETDVTGVDLLHFIGVGGVWLGRIVGADMKP